MDLEERIRDLKFKKSQLGITKNSNNIIEQTLEMKELDIAKLNYKVDELKEQANKRKDEFNIQRKK